MTEYPGPGCENGNSNTLYGPNIAIQTSLLALTTFCLAAHFYVRLRLLKTWSAQDILCVVLQLLFASYVGVASYSIGIGYGCHLEDVARSRKPTLLFYGNVISILYNVVLVFSKVTLLIIYLKIFAPTRFARNWWAMVSIMVANIVFFTTSTFLKIFPCFPRSRIWAHNEPGYCWVDPGDLVNASAIWNTISDLLIVLLPLHFVSQLQVGRSQKIRVMMMFCLGAILCPIMSIMGIVYRQLHFSDPDTTYWQIRVYIFCESEMGMGIVCCCIPALQRLARDLITSSSKLITRERLKNSPRSRAYVDGERRRQRGEEEDDIRGGTHRAIQLEEMHAISHARSGTHRRMNSAYFRTECHACPCTPTAELLDSAILVRTDIEVTYDELEPDLDLEVSYARILQAVHK